MHVVGHEHIGVQAATAFLERLAQPVAVSKVVVISKEAGIAVVSALDYVQRNTSQVDAGAAGHDTPA